jgi:bifunctional NMN adenylyltransferase/nudix hydrolase
MENTKIFKYPTCFTTVDIAVYDHVLNRVLLAKKPKQNLYRFVGGFSDPKNDSFEADAVRELEEETGLIVTTSDLIYLGTAKIDDERYRNTQDCIKTIFYLCKYKGGEPVANDDIESVKWESTYDLSTDMVVHEHKHLMDMLIPFLKNY